MLAVGIKLDRPVVAHLLCILQPGLKRARQTKIGRQVQQIVAVFFADARRIVLRAVVDHYILVLRIVLNQVIHHPLDVILLVISRDDYQCFHSSFSLLWFSAISVRRRAVSSHVKLRIRFR